MLGDEAPLNALEIAAMQLRVKSISRNALFRVLSRLPHQPTFSSSILCLQHALFWLQYQAIVSVVLR